MHIISLTSENIKRLTAVHIKPDGALVRITGKNDQGKSSVLDSIWWALAGVKSIQSVPIRKGADKAMIKLDLGSLVVTRKFSKKDDKEATTSLTVETDKGARYPTPQTVVDSLLGSLSFDPLAFTRMDQEAQFKAVSKFVDFDFAAHIKAQQKDYKDRTELNRRAQVHRNAASAITVPEGTPDDPINTDPIKTDLTNAADHNASVLAECQRRAAELKRADDIGNNAQDAVNNAEQAVVNARELLKRAEEALKAAVEAREHEYQKANDIRRTIEALPEVTQVNANDLRAKLDEAEATNKNVAQKQRKADLNAQAEAIEKEAKALTDAMEARDNAREAAIKAAKMPVEGLEFGDDVVLYNGVPFDQASSAVQLRVSCAIAMANNPELRVLRVKDGSLLDEASLKILEQMAVEKDFQVWIEQVSNGEQIGFVIEDGHLKEGQ